MSDWKERGAEKIFLLSTIISSSITLLILGFMAFMALPLLRGGGLFRLLTEPWMPQQGLYGIYPMIVGTAVISLLSLLFAFPLSLGCSFLISSIGPKSLSMIFRRMIQMMTGIPTVIYGFVGIFLLVPVIREFFQSGSGMCILTAALMLGVLISPTMILFFCDSFDRVPRSYIDAADYQSPEFRSIFACGLVLYLFITIVILAVRRLAFRESEERA